MINFNSNNLKTLSKYLENCLESGNVEVAINQVHIGEVTSFEISDSEFEEDYFVFVAYKDILSIGLVYFHKQDLVQVHCIHSKSNDYIGLIMINFKSPSI